MALSLKPSAPIHTTFHCIAELPRRFATGDLAVVVVGAKGDASALDMGPSSSGLLTLEV